MSKLKDWSLSSPNRTMKNWLIEAPYCGELREDLRGGVPREYASTEMTAGYCSVRTWRGLGSPLSLCKYCRIPIMWASRACSDLPVDGGLRRQRFFLRYGVRVTFGGLVGRSCRAAVCKQGNAISI